MALLQVKYVGREVSEQLLEPSQHFDLVKWLAQTWQRKRPEVYCLVKQALVRLGISTGKHQEDVCFASKGIC
jgi:hypothetical protein